MKSFLLLKYQKLQPKENIIIFLTAILFTFTTFTISFAEENIFTIKNVKVKGVIDLNFSRDKYLNKAFLNSFERLMSRILLTRDLKKVKKTNLKEIKKLINSFQIIEENYQQDIYNLKIKIYYNEKKIKKFLAYKNISYSSPGNISAFLYPALYINDEVQSFRKNFFYENWDLIQIENELINFILPIEDVEDISKIISMKENLEEFNIGSIAKKYNEKNYVFILMNHQNNKLNIYLKTNFNKNKVSKNITYNVQNIKDEEKLNTILKDLKLKINDLWKEENVVNTLMPLSIKIKFEHLNLENLQKLKADLNRMSIIDNYILEKFDINSSFFKIYYFGSPKKLKAELVRFGYNLKNDQGFWKIYLNE